MALVGCFVTPHPPIIISEIGGARTREAQSTVSAMQVLRERAATLQPETIVLLSPHAPSARRQMGVSMASSYHGSFSYFGAQHVRVSAEGDLETARVLFEAATKRDIPVVATGAGAQVIDADHGAMVPLWFLMAGLSQPAKIVILSFSGLGIDVHVSFGEAIGGAMLETSQRVIYVASGDMSHRLLRDGPYGLDPLGIEFDQAVEEAFATGDWGELLSIPPHIIEAAGECGFRSLAVLRGIVNAAGAAGVSTKNRLLSYEGPFGVGYLVGEVEFLRLPQEGAAE